MNSQFINRLVGTVIVVMAAVVFIPNILDGEKVQKRESFKEIPERPEFKAIELDAEPDQQLAREQLPAVPIIEESAIDENGSPFEEDLIDEAANQVIESDVVTEKEITTVDVGEPATSVGSDTPPLTRAENSNLDEFAWVVQLGSFSHKANVEALLRKLKEAGFTAFTKPVKTPSGSLTKVFVGPELDKTKLESELPKLKKLTKLEGRVTQFEITN